jgi:hypothetical protein
MSFIRKISLLAALAAVGAALMVPQVGAAPTAHSSTTQKFSVHLNLKNTNGKLSGFGTGTFGRCNISGTIVIPVTNQTWKCNKGTIRIKGTGTTGASNDAAGNVQILGGTGRYKGAKGTGKFSGKISTGRWVYTGTIRY